MATTYKILGQSAPSSTSNTALYTVPSSTSAVVSSITITNVTSSAAVANVYICKAGASPVAGNALVYGLSIAANSTISFTIGITLATTDVIEISTDTSSALTFQAFGSEIS